MFILRLMTVHWDNVLIDIDKVIDGIDLVNIGLDYFVCANNHLCYYTRLFYIIIISIIWEGGSDGAGEEHVK